jgi:hypothetical protein
MRRSVVVLLFVCFLGSSVTQAQGNDRWPPLAEDVFAPSVTVVSVEPVVDNEARVLYLPGSSGWRAYPYPDEFNEVGIQSDYYDTIWVNVYARPDGTWYVFERDAEKWYRFHTWILDPMTGAFAQADTPCHVDQDIREMDNSVLTSTLQHESAPFPDAWVVVPTTRSTALCSMLTGYISRPLPDNVVYWDYRYGVPILPRTSPDGQWVVFMTYQWKSGPGDEYHLYSYHPAADDLIDLGSFTPQLGEDVGGVYWIDNTRFAFGVSAMPEWSIRNVYVGDASQPDSVDFAASMLRFSPRVLRNPSSVEGMDAAMEDGTSAGPCFLEHYDALTREHTLYDTGDLCEYGIPIPDGSGDRLYRAILPAMTVTRYNLETGARRNLFTGEVEYVGNISPGGRYAVIGLGNNGAIDVEQDPNPNWDLDYYNNPGYFDAVVHQYLIMDLETGAWIREFPSSAHWFTDDLLTITPAEGTHSLIQLEHGAFTETELPGQVVLALPERDQLLLEYTDGSVKLYTASTGEVVPIINSINGLAYEVRRGTGETLRVSATRSTDLHNVRTFWTIQLP